VAARNRIVPVLAVLVALAAGRAGAEPLTWNFTLRPGDIVAGPALQKLDTRRHWNWEFDERDGKFEIAVRKAAFPAASPQCRMDYLILGMPLYYPENPKQASVPDRRAVYDALLAMQQTKKGSLPVHVEALSYARNTPQGPELTSCNIYFVLPLAPDAGKLLP
jgi:hypothetical protein